MRKSVTGTCPLEVELELEFDEVLEVGDGLDFVSCTYSGVPPCLSVLPRPAKRREVGQILSIFPKLSFPAVTICTALRIM